MKDEMSQNEALLIAEEILRLITIPNNHFTENMREYICGKLDISDEILKDVLDVISKIKDKGEKET